MMWMSRRASFALALTLLGAVVSCLNFSVNPIVKPTPPLPGWQVYQSAATGVGIALPVMVLRAGPLHVLNMQVPDTVFSSYESTLDKIAL
jgi:hypothetical protein